MTHFHPSLRSWIYSRWTRNRDRRRQLFSKMVDCIVSLVNDELDVLSIFIVKSKSTSILKKRPLVPSSSADSPMVNGKLVPEPTSSPIDLHPPPSVSSSIQNPMSPKPSTIQRLQSLFRHTPRKIYFHLSCIPIASLPLAASNRVINQLKTTSAGMGFGSSSSPLPGSPITTLQKTATLAMRKQTPKRRYRLRNRVNSNQ